ncbi:unnamed protein product [Cuscuta epithymum]|uniref:Uncharacterized protein n=1 Tax=Cuscuta epithymum TaxID=186058 RepID=A0AAV0D2Q9_9ASTE|nr:unnamed protein product [Cuscuta epithymum]
MSVFLKYRLPNTRTLVVPGRRFKRGMDRWFVFSLAQNSIQKLLDDFPIECINHRPPDSIHINTSRNINYRVADDGEVERGNNRPPTIGLQITCRTRNDANRLPKRQALDES